ncbi:MAG: glycosyltransferase family 2 protein [Actinomycetota bacterium]
MGESLKIVSVVLNYRRPEETIACVESLHADQPGIETIVVDNDSGDGSAERLAGALTDIVLVRNASNLGYAGGNNVGIRRALSDGADAVLILNNDLKVESGCVKSLEAALQENAWGMAGPLSYLADSDVVDFFTGRVLLDHAALLVPGRDERRGDRFGRDKTSEYLTGSALLVRKNVFDSIGLFDERFFLVWEDVDFSVRATRAGFLLGATPNAIVRHARSITFGGEESPLQRYFFVRNPYLLIRKHLHAPKRWVSEALITRRYRHWANDKEADAQVSKAIARGYRDGLRGRFGPPPSWLAP